MTTVHSADPPRHFQELARELDVALLRGPRDAMLALARVARRHPFEAVDGARHDARRLRSPDDSGALPEHESSLILERLGVPVRSASPSGDTGGSGRRDRGARHAGRRQARRPGAQGARAAASSLGVASPAEAADAARRLGGPVLVARQVESGAEVLCGMTRDPDFGPILAVGRGGVAVEELDSVVLSSAPLDRRGAAALVAEAGIDDRTRCRRGDARRP